MDKISFDLKYFENACREKGDKDLAKPAKVAQLLRVYSVDKLSKNLRTEAGRLGNQIERCNLYYQSKLNTTAVKTAYVALVISVLSIFFTIIGILKII